MPLFSLSSSFLCCLCLFLVCLFSLKIIKLPTFETFRTHCSECTKKPIGKCLNCSNCGFLYKGSYGMCTGGDMYGPYEYEYIRNNNIQIGRAHV